MTILSSFYPELKYEIVADAVRNHRTLQRLLEENEQNAVESPEIEGKSATQMGNLLFKKLVVTNAEAEKVEE
jgi:hypothetical protein